MNQKLLKSYCFLIFSIQFVADFIEDKTTLDDRWHAGEVQGEMVVNIALAKSQAHICRWVSVSFNNMFS